MKWFSNPYGVYPAILKLTRQYLYNIETAYLELLLFIGRDFQMAVII